ncbi:hypothetical protein [Limnohabitans sp. INBF002]|uniref:hypothetical protein n=1 Tax=Limnohabitans sp. INBF002 TaxID=2986280 RepID=UPI002377ABE8|nr:hypothetical protein [Limnohabitans sp. INBF002]BDU53384.1 hypothetical protein LINBF2_16190 [Limnohabitans sp. INBF002]
MKKVYHYTKGYKVGSIILNQEINAIAPAIVGLPNENLVWLTKEDSYPTSALPMIPELPETSLINQLKSRAPVDHLKVAKYLGGIWRFAFDFDKHPEIKAWYGSYQRNKLVRTPYGKTLELTAKKVGDRVDLWAIASRRLLINNSTLQQLTPQGWVSRISFFKEGNESMVEEFNGASSSKIVRDSMRLKQSLLG